MKKLFYIFLILILTVLLSLVLHYDGQVIINTNNYEIITNIKTIFLLEFIFFTLFEGIFFLINTITRISKDKINKKINKKSKKYENYMKNIEEAILHNLSNDFKLAHNSLKKADKYIKSNLTNLVETQILFNQHKYQESFFIISRLNFRSYKINKKSRELLMNNLKLDDAIYNNDDEKIKIFANKILEKEPKNLKCLFILYDTYKKENNWILCEKLLPKIKKNVENYREETIFVEKNLAEFYFKNNDFKNSLNYSTKVFNKDKNIYTNNRILILSIINIKPKKANRYIEKIWKYTPKIWIGNLYLNNFSLSKKIKAAKSLFKINKNDINSVIFFCNILIENNRIDLIDESIKNILQNYDYKEVFEILAKIEEKSENSQFLIEKYKEKAINSQRIENE